MGKELAAEAIHRLGVRRKAALISFNCAAVSRDLVAAELFGVRKGAYTGAFRDLPGVVSQADGGTLFWDEIADLPHKEQGTLLRFCDNAQIQPVGGAGASVVVDAQLITATNRKTVDCCPLGLRRDLYERLAGIEILLPTLEKRKNDLAYFIEYFMRPAHLASGGTVSDRYQFFLRVRRELDAGSQAVAEHVWPGNVRELRMAVLRGIAFEGGDQWLLVWKHLRDHVSRRAGDEDRLETRAKETTSVLSSWLSDLNADPDAPYDELLEVITARLVERRFRRALEQTKGRHDLALRRLGISRSRYFELKKRYLDEREPSTNDVNSDDPGSQE